MTVASAEVVVIGFPVVGELDHRMGVLVAVTDEGEGEAARGIVLAAQQPHAENVAVKSQRLLQVAHPEHGVEHAHVVPPD